MVAGIELKQNQANMGNNICYCVNEISRSTPSSKFRNFEEGLHNKFKSRAETYTLRNTYHWTLAALAFLLVVAIPLQPHRVQAAPLPQEYTYGECSRADEAAVKAEMATLAHAVLVEGSSGLQ